MSKNKEKQIKTTFDFFKGTVSFNPDLHYNLDVLVKQTIYECALFYWKQQGKTLYKVCDTTDFKYKKLKQIKKALKALKPLIHKKTNTDEEETVIDLNINILFKHHNNFWI